MPEYVAFTQRPIWGIGQVQIVGGSIFGQSRWVALSDVLPADPERLPAKIQVPHPTIESAGPVPRVTPAARLAAGMVPIAERSQDHFRRLCAYWLQAENRQGQLDSIPMLSLRHQASLVEHLMRRDTPTRMLIGDEVGLGKTVEIALLIERLRAANPDLRVLYITLGGLVANVADEFNNMGLDIFYVYGNQVLYQQGYRSARLGSDDQDPRVVASIHRLAFGSNWESRLAGAAKWDMVVVDECHRLRMYGTGENQTAQKWFRVVERVLTSHLAENGRVYFLSGTPHQGNPDVFLNLAGLLCGLPRGATPKEQRSALGGRVIFRIKEEVHDWEDKPLFPKRDIRDPVLAPTSAEYNALLLAIGDYFDWLLSGGTHLSRETRYAIGFVKSNALQYAASSPKAGFSYLLRRYLRNFGSEGNETRMENWAGLLVPYRNRSVREKPRELLAYLMKTVEQDADEDGDEDAGALTEAVGPAASNDAREEEKRRLGLLLDQYARLLKGPDAQSKFDVLKRLLGEADEPFVVFAQSLDTVYEIRRLLNQWIPSSIIVGGQDPAERKRQMEIFREPGRLGRRALVSSAAGGEGINLQIARRLIHFDLPWNPMVLEQRIGRIHRIGTIDTVIVQTILLEDSREADIYSRLITRLNTIVGVLAQDPEVRTQYFRRILAGIPLETLRTLFSGERGDDDAVAAAVEEGKRAVDLVDEELRQHRVQLTAEDQGRATMARLVQLLLSGAKIRKINKSVKFTRVMFNPDTEAFFSEELERPCYRINHGSPNAGVDWVVFDREAAAGSAEVTKERTGGINHPLIALALRTLRTPSDTADFDNLAIGIGSYDPTSELGILAGNSRRESIAILTYLVAFNHGGQFFNHRLFVFAFSPTRDEYIEISQEGRLIEDIFWSQLEKDHSSRICPELAPTALENIEKRDRMLRLDLEASVKDDSGNWIGAIWPIGISLLMPE
jgi:superfamily II DNA or RNA helicase